MLVSERSCATLDLIRYGDYKVIAVVSSRSRIKLRASRGTFRPLPYAAQQMRGHSVFGSTGNDLPTDGTSRPAGTAPGLWDHFLCRWTHTIRRTALGDASAQFPHGSAGGGWRWEMIRLRGSVPGVPGVIRFCLTPDVCSVVQPPRGRAVSYGVVQCHSGSAGQVKGMSRVSAGGKRPPTSGRRTLTGRRSQRDVRPSGAVDSPLDLMSGTGSWVADR